VLVCGSQVVAVFQAKAIADSKCDRAHKPREPIQHFLKNYLIRKFGLRSTPDPRYINTQCCKQLSRSTW
jgi:hypothetical protein